jgi:uncharacterized membrane protein
LQSDWVTKFASLIFCDCSKWIVPSIDRVHMVLERTRFVNCSLLFVSTCYSRGTFVSLLSDPLHLQMDSDILY